jgi:hypothetical protein
VIFYWWDAEQYINPLKTVAVHLHFTEVLFMAWYHSSTDSVITRCYSIFSYSSAK